MSKKQNKNLTNKSEVEEKKALETEQKQYHLNKEDSLYVYEKFLNNSRLFDHESIVIEKFKKAFKNNSSLSLLDFGCGAGRFVKVLNRIVPNFDLSNYFIFDESKTMLEIVQKQFSNISVIDFDSLKTKEFDYIISFDVLQHQKDFNSFLETLKSLKTNNLFLTCWVSKDGNDKNNEIKLPSGNLYPEIIFSYKEIQEIADKFNLGLEIFDMNNPLTLTKPALLFKSV